MADMKIPANLPAPLTRAPGARTEALRSAQRAFFDAAMTQTQAKAPETKAKPRTEEAAQTAETRRYPRPGSRVDIKV